MKYTWLSCITLLLFACQTKTPNQNRNYNNLKFGTLPVAVKANFNQQQISAHVLVEPEYYVWGTSVVKWNDKYHAYYSRWQKKYKHKGKKPCLHNTNQKNKAFLGVKHCLSNMGIYHRQYTNQTEKST